MSYDPWDQADSAEPRPFELFGQIYTSAEAVVFEPTGDLKPDLWHDVIVRYDGQRLEMLVDGIPVADQAAAGSLRSGNTEPLVE